VLLVDAADRLAVIEDIPVFEVREGRGLLNSGTAKGEGPLLSYNRRSNEPGAD